MFQRVWASLGMAAGLAAAGAGGAAAQAKFVSLSPDGAHEVRVLGGIDLPQVGTPAPGGPKRVRARIGDATLQDYARASLLALEVHEKYVGQVRQAETAHQARMIAASANGELAAVLDRSGVMDHRTFQAISRALKADPALARRARAVAQEVLPRQSAALISQPNR